MTISLKFSWMSTDGQGTKCRRNIAENYNRLRRLHERYRQTDRCQATDGRCLSQWLLSDMATSSSDGVSVTRCCQNIGAYLYVQSTGLLQCTAVWRVGRADASSTISPAVRLLTGARRRDHITPILRHQLHWLLVRQSVTFKIAVLVF